MRSIRPLPTRSCARAAARPVEVPASEHRARLLLALLFGLALVACGSGAGGGPTAPAALNEAAVAGHSLELANAVRAREGLATLAFDQELAAIALAHSTAMRDGRFFGHADPTGNGLRHRLEAAAVAFSAAGENLAQVAQRSDPAGVAHQQFLSSPDHRQVMLDVRFTQVGIGVARDGDTFWITQVYLRP